MACYHADRQGHVRWLTNSAKAMPGSVLGTLTYDDFGRPTSNTGSTDCYQYTAREYDPSTATTGTGGEGLQASNASPR